MLALQVCGVAVGCAPDRHRKKSPIVVTCLLRHTIEYVDLTSPNMAGITICLHLGKSATEGQYYSILNKILQSAGNVMDRCNTEKPNVTK